MRVDYTGRALAGLLACCCMLTVGWAHSCIAAVPVKPGNFEELDSGRLTGAHVVSCDWIMRPGVVCCMRIGHVLHVTGLMCCMVMDYVVPH